MSRWPVQLDGERADLEEFPRKFPDGEVFAIEENENFFLVGPALEVFSDAPAVRKEAIRALDRFSAIVMLLWPSLRKPTAGDVFRETDGGRRDAFVFLSAGLSLRAKVNCVAVSADGIQEEPQRTQAQELLSRTIGNPRLEQALALWAVQPRTWPLLYRIMEEIEQHLGVHVDVAGLSATKRRERFTRTANTAEVSGADSRHASGKFVAPDNPMTLPEATEFIGQMLLEVLRRPF